MPTLDQIQEKMRKLQAQAESLIAKQTQSVLNDIRALMEKHGLTTHDIDSNVPVKKRPGRPAGSKANVVAGKRTKTKAKALKGKLPPLYRDPETGATWSGWARPPAWIKNVADRSTFLIDASAAKQVIKGATAKKTAKPKVVKVVTTRKAAVKRGTSSRARKMANSSRAMPVSAQASNDPVSALSLAS